MLNIRDLRIDPASLGSKKLLVDISPAYEYKDGKRTDNLTGYRYTVALPEHGLDKISVRIDGKQLIEKPEGYQERERRPRPERGERTERGERRPRPERGERRPRPDRGERRPRQESQNDETAQTFNEAPKDFTDVLDKFDF